MAINAGTLPDAGLVILDVDHGGDVATAFYFANCCTHCGQLAFLTLWQGILLGATCLIQFALSKWMDSRYEPSLGKNYYWMIWYPFVFWLITITATIVAFPKVLLRNDGKRARWISPDRGIR